MKKFLILIIPFIIWGCETNPPTQPLNPVIEYGNVKVISNVAGAKIFLDGNDTGKLTPDTLKTTIGDHIIELSKDNYDTTTISINVLKNTEIEITANLFASNKTVID